MANIREILSYRGLPYPLRPANLVDGQNGLSNYSAVYDKLGRIIKQPVWINEVLLPNAILNISIQNKIIETAVSGRVGTVDEYVSAQDYVISIDGLVVSENGQLPVAEMAKIEKLAHSKEKLTIKSELIDELQIEYCVIKNINIQNTAKTNSIAYSIDAKSTTDYDLIIE